MVVNGGNQDCEGDSWESTTIGCQCGKQNDVEKGLLRILFLLAAFVGLCAAAIARSGPGTHTMSYTDSNSLPKEFDTTCLEGGWLVIQTRGQFGNPEDYFLRGWDEYVAGFGVPGEHCRLI